ncbi:Nif3-like dinuclear metal center hexameric protein [Terasakiispira papahanaumokuakeensis]|uniref:GTP cyclohydrolase 1 type 2 homolog n=1 Tax=Terasakiispira papahanaumokuakeensis TaxID=197479 RepID=A0A1E2V754_9GAMM|nr:Nif3-like dinuclear metal center hexameric protein [Terasakiispira papahanaumokuakeensis]ODC02682.1 Nif3-like dinuclear metal center hexameric protein [Terasakiispira papahanaumokuakeensis]
MSVPLSTLCEAMNQELAVNQFQDYCPNGLQVEASDQVSHIVTGVTACQALIDAAIERQADMLLVHHGYFWKGESPALVGMKGRRIRHLMQHGINLVAYHLPLDAHPVLGNNACLAEQLGLVTETGLDSSDHPIGNIGILETPLTGAALAARIEQVLGRSPLHIAGHEGLIRRVGWCTGAAHSMLNKAADLGLDAFISGEINEPTVHLARERGIDYFAAGHHATERYGVQALGRWLAQRFDVSCEFIDIDNPV